MGLFLNDLVIELFKKPDTLPRMKRFAIIALAIAAIAVVGLYFSTSAIAGMKLKAALKEAGFHDVHIAGTDRIPGGYVFRNIRLDNNGFSTIKSVVVQTMGTEKIFTIDKIILTGDWKTLKSPDIAGWTMPEKRTGFLKHLREKGFTALQLEGGQFDADTPFIGMVRFEARGQINFLPDGSLRVQSVLWTAQRKIKTTLALNGEFSAKNKASVDIEINEGNINIGDFSLSRLGGWLILNRADDHPWSISSQIVAGTAKYHGIGVTGLVLASEGTAQDAKITLKSGSNENFLLTGDARVRNNGGDHLSLSLRAEDVSLLKQAYKGMDPSPENLPGAVFALNANADTVKTLAKQATVGVSDLAGNFWMLGQVRKTDKGVDLGIKNLDLARLNEALNISGLKITGTMHGMIPLRKNDDGQIVFDQGLLQSLENGGTINYTAPALPPGVQSRRNDVVEALHDFQYDKLEMSVAGTISDRLRGDIAMTGMTGQQKSLLTLQYGFSDQPQN